MDIPIDSLVYVLASVFTVFYLVLIFQFYEKVSHFGPFQSKTRRMIYLRRDMSGEVIEKYEQPITIFDWVRRLFGVYRIEKEECTDNDTFDIGCEEGEVWFVRQERMEVWECTTCLSGWVALIPALVSLLQFPFVWAFIIWGASAGLSSILHVQLYGKEVTIEYLDDGEEEDYGANHA